MTFSAPTKMLTKKMSIPMLALAAYGLSGCTPISENEKEFVEMYGFGREDHFGAHSGHNHVPAAAEKPIRPTGREIKTGRPGSRNNY